VALQWLGMEAQAVELVGQAGTAIEDPVLSVADTRT
jgi:hypothetical protein